MIGTLRRHSTVLWFVVITATIGSFLILGPTNARMGNAFTMFFSGGNNGYGTLAGKPITVTDYQNAYKEVALNAFLQTKKWPEDPNSFQIKRETYMRLFIIEKQQELGIVISTDAAAAYAARILGGLPLDDFAEKILKPVGLDASDFDRYLRHQLGLDQLMRLTGMTGMLVSPQEAEAMFRQENQEIETELAHFSASNYLAQVQVTPAALGTFYSNQLANYRVPERVQVQYVKFNVTNYFGEVQSKMTNETQINQLIDSFARQNFGTNLFPGTRTIDESRASIRMAIVKTNAIILARRAASEFGSQLDADTPHTLEKFHQLAATNRLKVMDEEPFGREFGPEDLDVPPQFAQAAFSLSPDELFSGAIPADDGVYVLAYIGKTPSRTPALADIRSKVTEDFKYASAIQIAQQDSLKLASLLNNPTNGLASGRSFAAFCAQAGIKAMPLPPFAAATRSLPDEIEHDIDLNTLKQAAFSVSPGRASAPAGARDGAFIVYVIRDLPIDENKVKTELPAFLNYVRSARANDTFNQWFNAQARLDQPFVQYVQHLAEQMQAGGTRSRPGS